MDKIGHNFNSGYNCTKMAEFIDIHDGIYETEVVNDQINPDAFHVSLLEDICIYDKDRLPYLCYDLEHLDFIECSMYECASHFKCPFTYCIPHHHVCMIHHWFQRFDH